MGDCGHNRHRRKEGEGLPCPFRGQLGLCLIQCALDRGLLPYQVASSSIQPFGHNRHGPKIGWGWVCCFFSGGSWVPIEHSHLGRGLHPYQVTSWWHQPFGHNNKKVKYFNFPFQTYLASNFYIHISLLKTYNNVSVIVFFYQLSYVSSHKIFKLQNADFAWAILVFTSFFTSSVSCYPTAEVICNLRLAVVYSDKINLNFALESVSTTTTRTTTTTSTLGFFWFDQPWRCLYYSEWSPCA